MTLHYIDGFDDTVATVSRWSTTPTTTTGRFGGLCAGTNPSGGEYITFPDTSELIIGFAHKCNAFKANWFCGVGNSDGVQLSIAAQTNIPEIRVYRGARYADVTGLTKATIAGEWKYVEMRCTLADSGGVVQLWVDGQNIGTWTGDTRYAGTQTVFNRLYIGNGDGWSGNFVDDLYIMAVDATSPNTRLGDCKVTTLFPSGNGTTSGGAGSDGNSTDNYALVDESSYSAADYVDFATTVKDTYAYGDAGLDSGATIHGVQVCSYIAKTDAGSITAKPVVRLSGTEVDGTAVTPASTTAYEFDEVFVTKPGGGAWSAANVDAAEFGLKGV